MSIDFEQLGLVRHSTSLSNRFSIYYSDLFNAFLRNTDEKESIFKKGIYENQRKHTILCVRRLHPTFKNFAKKLIQVAILFFVIIL